MILLVVEGIEVLILSKDGILRRSSRDQVFPQPMTWFMLNEVGTVKALHGLGLMHFTTRLPTVRFQ